jgi:hypothetical protein
MRAPDPSGNKENGSWVKETIPDAVKQLTSQNPCNGGHHGIQYQTKHHCHATGYEHMHWKDFLPLDENSRNDHCAKLAACSEGIQ